jgi:hypothetical protein
LHGGEGILGGKLRDMDGLSREGGAYGEGIPVRRVYNAYEGRETIAVYELLGEIWFLEGVEG